MNRGLLNFLAVVSALACVVATVRWFREDRLLATMEMDFNRGTRPLTPAERATPGTWTTLKSWDFAGLRVARELHYYFNDHISDADRAKLPNGGVREGGEPSPELENLYTSINNRTGSGMMVLSIRFPYWLLILLTLPMPLWWLRRHQQSRVRLQRLASGLCPQCGYNLSASPDRCPECGTASRTLMSK